MRRGTVKQDSKLYSFIFKKLLAVMNSPLRSCFNNPQKLIKASGVQSGQTVLEVGCGSGFFTPALSDIVGNEGHVHSIDLEMMAVESTRCKIKKLDKQNVCVSKVDVHKTEFASETFDTIVLYGVIPAPFISEKRLAPEMYRILKSEGTLAVWTLVPLWSPRNITEASQFTVFNKRNGVYRFNK